MNHIQAYFRRVGARRVIGMIIGNLIIGCGCGFFKWSIMGNDPFSACAMALSALTGIAYGPFIILYNLFFFIFQILWGRKYIGIGTIVNGMGLGFFTQGAYDLLRLIGQPVAFFPRLCVMLLGVLIIAIGLSLYQTSDTGIAPYDALSIMMHEYWHIPYFWCRMMTDVVCAAVCWICGGLLGLGTLACCFGVGPVVHLMDGLFSEKVLRHKVGERNRELA